MPIQIDDKYLEKLIEAEQAKRGDSTKTRTAVALLRERLAMLDAAPSIAAPQHLGQDLDITA